MRIEDVLFEHELRWSAPYKGYCSCDQWHSVSDVRIGFIQHQALALRASGAK